MHRFVKGLVVVAGLWVGMNSSAQAELDALTQHALDSYRLTLQEHPNSPQRQVNEAAVESQAAYLMLIKNGLSLYRDNVLQTSDEVKLRQLVDQQIEFSNTALAQAQSLPATKRSLLKDIHAAALAAQQLLTANTDSPSFRGLMDSYHNGIGYMAYRHAQDKGIDQYWVDAPQ